MRILIPTFPASQSTEVPVTAEGPAAAQAAALPIAFAIGAHYGVHESGDEGWLHRVGAFGSILHKNRLSFRILAAYLVPIGFNARAADVPSARVDLSGAYAEARAGWRTGPLGTVRGVVEAGVGMLYAEWKTSGPADAGSRTGGGVRMYGVASAGIAWSVGPLSVGAQIELAVPTNDTSYEVETDGKRQKMASSWLNPGANLEITVPLSSGAGESARHVENEPRGRGPLGCIRPSSTEVH